MRTPHNIIDGIRRQTPAELLEAATPWIISLLGAAMIAIMSYSWLAAWWPK